MSASPQLKPPQKWGGFLCTGHIYIYMAILLQELTTPIRYTSKDPRQMLYDFTAAYELWRRLGSESSEPIPQARQKIIDLLFQTVTEKFAAELLTHATKALVNYKDQHQKEYATVLKKMDHDLKMHDAKELASDIRDTFFVLFAKNGGRIGNMGIERSDVRTSQKLAHPARLITHVSPIVARIIKANLHYFGPVDKIGAELGKDEKVISAPRGVWTPEEKEKVMALGLDIIGAGNSQSRGSSGQERLSFDKLKDGRYLYFSNDKMTIEEFDTFEDALSYLIQNKAKFSGRKGQDRAYIPTPTAQPSQPAPPDLVPAPKSPLQPLAVGAVPKRLSSNWEKVLAGFHYDWNDAEHGYVKNLSDDRMIKIVVMPDNTTTAIFPNGKTRHFPNLGEMFRTLAHSKTRRQANKADEPQVKAQVTEANFKDLYQFLYGSE
jgi:hypothetical protein